MLKLLHLTLFICVKGKFAIYLYQKAEGKSEAENKKDIMRLFRSIALNENEDIDTDNIGNSWTLCEVFAQDHFDDYNGFAQKDGYVILSIEVDEKDIDMNNTLFAMDRREYEFEVIVNNLDIEAEVHETNLESFEDVDKIKGNTGENYFEDYCNNYEGELTKQDFIELANEF